MIIIIIISIFKEENVFSIIANLPYGPPVNTDIDYYQTFFGLLSFVSVAMLVVYYLLGMNVSQLLRECLVTVARHSQCLMTVKQVL